MFEQLLSSIAKAKPMAPPIFLYDPVTNTDLMGNATITTVGTRKLDDTYKIFGDSTLLFDGTNGVNVQFANPNLLDFYNSDWTVEWATRNNSPALLDYGNELWMTTTTGNWIGCQYTNQGFGYLRQFSAGTWTPEGDLYRIPVAQNLLPGVLTNYAMVCRNKVIKIYIDGQQAMMANGSGNNTFNKPSFNIATTVGKIKELNIGIAPAGGKSFPSNRSRIRISNYARYLANYTPTRLTES